MFRLFTKHQALILTLFFILSGCGSDSASTPTGSQGNTTSCPVGFWNGAGPSSATLSVGNTGLVRTTDGGCGSVGYATCLGQDLVLTIDYADETIESNPRCMQPGNYQCTYSINSATFVVVCPQDVPGNTYKAGKEFFR